MSVRVKTIGVISDTHGWLHPGVRQAFAGVDLIIHAGDIDSPEILTRLRRLAPVIAVRGNMDVGDWTAMLPENDLVEIDGTFIYVIHNLHRLDIDLDAAGVDVVVCGHTHEQLIHWQGRVLVLNPGSASLPRRASGASVIRLVVENGRLHPRPVDLENGDDDR